MITTVDFSYKPSDEESEKASNSYLMSVIAVMGGMPFPIINLIATFAFFMANRKSSFFVRWHCWQALLSQFSFIFMNSASFYWTLSIIFGNSEFSNKYIAFIITVIIFNLIEFVATIYTAIQTRKGKHVEWWFYSDLTNLICRN